jgi:hypothetical protein
MGGLFFAEPRALKAGWIQSMLYQVDGKRDLAMVLAAIDGFSEEWNLRNVAIDLDKVEAVLVGMRHDFPALGGTDAASPFKKAANFFCYFVAECPVKNPFPQHAVGATISAIPNHQNVMLGFSIAIDALHNATIKRSDMNIVLSNRIKMSKHSYIDTIHACKSLVPQTHFHIVSVLLEQLCYRFNPHASYDLIDI